MKAARGKLGIGRNQIYVIEDKDGNVIFIFERIVQVAEQFYTELHNSQTNLRTVSSSIGATQKETPVVTKGEVRKALNAMPRRKAADEDAVTVHLLKDGGDTVLGKLATLYTQCFMT